ncbi:hypothetical protein ACHHV8_29005 [Paenibacillus sp. TAB 01]|uniref:hypothetical protein n=1 Tax=Paenibacillus sp. TAB 01 TaxID=3368988 RepID=UPI003751BA4F
MDMEHGSFSFFPFGALFCLTLFSFVVVRIYAIGHRYGDSNQNGLAIALILEGRMVRGENEEEEYQRLNDLSNKNNNFLISPQVRGSTFGNEEVNG